MGVQKETLLNVEMTQKVRITRGKTYSWHLKNPISPTWALDLQTALHSSSRLGLTLAVWHLCSSIGVFS